MRTKLELGLMYQERARLAFQLYWHLVEYNDHGQYDAIIIQWQGELAVLYSLARRYLRGVK